MRALFKKHWKKAGNLSHSGAILSPNFLRISPALGVEVQVAVRLSLPCCGGVAPED